MVSESLTAFLLLNIEKGVLHVMNIAEKQNLLDVVKSIEEKLEANGKLRDALEAVEKGKRPDCCEDDLVSMYICLKKMCKQIGVL